VASELRQAIRRLPGVMNRWPLSSGKRFDAFLESGWVRKVSCCTVIDILFHRLNNCPNVKHCTLWVKNKTLSQTQFMTTQFTRVTARQTDRQTDNKTITVCFITDRQTDIQGDRQRDREVEYTGSISVGKQPAPTRVR